jgi:hypothetical protein
MEICECAAFLQNAKNKIVRLIGANFWQNCSIDEESMKLSTQVL